MSETSPTNPTNITCSSCPEESSVTKPTATSDVSCPTNESASKNTDAKDTTVSSTKPCQSCPTSINTDAQKVHQDQDYYHLLGVKRNAPRVEIEHAYKRLASKYHPTRFHEDPVDAQKKFQQLTQAFTVLSNPSRRDHYDQIHHHQYSKQDALKTFERFFRHNGILEEEQEFFKKHYPNRKLNFYQILGVKRDASLADIQNAFRKLSITHHPKNEGEASKLTQVGQAYHTLGDNSRRAHYDKLEFGEMQPHQAHRHFAQKYNEQDQVLCPIVKKAILKPQYPTHHHHPHHAHHHLIEQITKQTYQQKTVDGTVTKAITHKSSTTNGKKLDVMVEEVTKPDGTTNITQTVRHDGHETKVKRYELKAGENKPALAA